MEQAVLNEVIGYLDVATQEIDAAVSALEYDGGSLTDVNREQLREAIGGVRDALAGFLRTDAYEDATA